MKWKTSLNASEFEKHYEINEGESMTIPDMSYSTRELLNRYAKGLPLDGVRVPIYEGEEPGMPDLTGLDLIDRRRVLEEVEQEILEIKERQRQKERERYDVERKKVVDDLVAKKIEEIRKEKEVGNEPQ